MEGKKPVNVNEKKLHNHDLLGAVPLDQITYFQIIETINQI